MPQSNPDWKPSSVGIALAAYQPYPIWFAEQLDSLVAQTHSNWHCVITMDSPLRDIQGAAQLQPYLGDPRFTWVENTERLGVRKNFEKAIRLAAQRDVDLIAFADQDDIWVPEKLAESVDAIKHSGPMSLVTTDAYLFSEELILSETIASLHRITRTNLTIEEIIIYPSVTGLTVLVDADLVRLHPQIPAPMRYHDH
jgi:GT2 family glycosyltransferase